jgi:hypothetical protein
MEDMRDKPVGKKVTEIPEAEIVAKSAPKKKTAKKSKASKAKRRKKS